MSDRADEQIPEEGAQRLEVPAEAAGARLDRFVAAALQLPRRRVILAIEAGRVRVDGRRGRKGQALAPGQEVIASLSLEDPRPRPDPDPPLEVIEEDPAFVVVSKRSGEPTHPLVAGERGTLANRLVARFPECAEASADPREGGVAHRLDGPTSGLVVAARERTAWEALRRDFGERRVRKEYLALVAGALEGPLLLETPIGPEPGARGRMRAGEGAGARQAHTEVEVEERFEGWTLVRCIITTGVMHQIRVHLAHAGHPVAGDDRYGVPGPAGLGRLFLHAAVLGFRHPVDGTQLTFRSPLPPELAAVLGALRGSEGEEVGGAGRR